MTRPLYLLCWVEAEIQAVGQLCVSYLVQQQHASVVMQEGQQWQLTFVLDCDSWGTGQIEALRPWGASRQDLLKLIEEVHHLALSEQSVMATTSNTSVVMIWECCKALYHFKLPKDNIRYTYKASHDWWKIPQHYCCSLCHRIPLGCCNINTTLCCHRT
jgi:hypothetical protein